MASINASKLLTKGLIQNTSASTAAAHATPLPTRHTQDEVEAETIHRLCPEYARDTINSPLRHVRTRIYFTSESHIHSLVNVLRLCHLAPHGGHAHGTPTHGCVRCVRCACAVRACLCARVCVRCTCAVRACVRALHVRCALCVRVCVHAHALC